MEEYPTLTLPRGVPRQGDGAGFQPLPLLLTQNRSLHQSRPHSSRGETNKPIRIWPRCECVDSPWGLAGTGVPFQVGLYEDLVKVNRGTGLDAHHVGQKARMSNLVANYDLNKAPDILVPASGHSSIDPVRGRLSTSAINPRTKKPFANARELLARDIKELRRAYPEIPNSQLQELIDLNKSMYPEMNKPPRGKH